MEQKPKSGKSPSDDRDARLKAALKANLARRKSQAKARNNGGKTQTGTQDNKVDPTTDNKD